MTPARCIVSVVSAVVATLVGFAFAWRDSWEYWTDTVRNTDRIGTATLNTNQNIAGALARLGLGEGERFVLWTLACFAVLGVTIWAARRVLRAGEPVLALICVAMFGLVVSPVSWSHHWVWALPTVIVCSVVAFRHRNALLGAVTAAGVALMVWTPITLMPEHHETTASLWRQLVGGSYVWWALAVIVVTGTVSARQTDSRTRGGQRRRSGAGYELGSELRGGLFTLLDVGGVQVDVFLTRQSHQLVHHLVDDRPLDEPVALEALEPAEVHRLAEPARSPARTATSCCPAG